MRYVKKPVEVEAEQYDANAKMFPNGVCFCGRPSGAHCHTLEGPLAVSNGDWIIKGMKGEVYPCKPDIFEMTYRLVPGQEESAFMELFEDKGT